MVLYTACSDFFINLLLYLSTTEHMFAHTPIISFSGQLSSICRFTAVVQIFVFSLFLGQVVSISNVHWICRNLNFIFCLLCINISFSTLNYFKNCTIPQRSCLVGGYLLLLVDYVLNRFLLLDIPYWDLWNICCINCIFMAGGLVQL